MVLELDRVAHSYGQTLVFRDISCKFGAGSVTLLLGGNGAGKSTLLRVMAGLTRPSFGTVRFAEKSGKIGHLAHSTFVYPALTALENLTFWREAYCLAATRDEMFKILERVGLAARACDRAGTFSRGMAQRLNLARILLLDPDVLLLDEPDTGLDAASRALLRRELLEARGRGACVVLASHDIASDAPLADRVLLLENGRLAHDGPPSPFFPPLAGAEQACCA
ncbi:MAG: ABC transporter ATP-binding protein [Desulfovibrio sp.]|jgi:heme exporter protein A|nr:ABC transporter ATP-binding protein [Desulfovibrio sp.]